MVWAHCAQTIVSLQGAKFALCAWCGSLRPASFSVSSYQKDNLIFYRNNASEQYQRNTDIIPKLFDIVPKVNIRSVLDVYFNFQPQKTIKIR